MAFPFLTRRKIPRAERQIRPGAPCWVCGAVDAAHETIACHALLNGVLWRTHKVRGTLRYQALANVISTSGLRPVRGDWILAEKAPKPRNSTRSLRAIAATISPNMALMLFSTSRLAADGVVTAGPRFSSSIDKV